MDKSLVSVDGSAAAPRYRLLDTTRAYGQAKLDEAREREATEKRRAIYLRDILQKENGGSRVNQAKLFAEHIGNARAGLKWCFSGAGDVRLGIELAALSGPMFLESSLLAECQRWVEIAIARLGPDDLGGRLEMNLQAARGRVDDVHARAIANRFTLHWREQRLVWLCILVVTSPGAAPMSATQRMANRHRDGGLSDPSAPTTLTKRRDREQRGQNGHGLIPINEKRRWAGRLCRATWAGAAIGTTLSLGYTGLPR